MAIRKIKKTWWVDFRFNRARYRKRSPYNSMSGAQAYESALRQKLASGFSLDEKPKEQDQLFKKFAWTWFETYVKNNNKASTISNKKYILKNQLIPFFGKTPLNQITIGLVEKFKAEKRKKKSQKTINNYLEVLRTCLNCAQEWYDLEKVPKIKKSKSPPVSFDFLTQRECEWLSSKLEDVWKDIFVVATKTGLRMGELRGLRWQDINWNNRTLTVNHSWCNYGKGLVSPKSNKTRNVPLVSEVYNLLFQRKEKTGFIFLDEFEGMFNDSRFNRELEKACKKAELRRITCHKLRHTFASHLAMAGAPIPSIQQLMGHADIQTTMRYAHLSPSSLKNVIDLLDSKEQSQNFGQLAVNREFLRLKNPEVIRVPSSEISLF